jgi:hypothetical protein
MTGIRVDYPMPDFYFLTKFTIQCKNFGIAHVIPKFAKIHIITASIQ